jgi:hypothetical protein
LCVLTEANANSPEFTGEVWRNLVPESEIAIVPGDHFSCLSTHVEPLANCLRVGLGKLESGETSLRDAA